MNNEEKILAMLTQMQADISGMKNDMTGIKTRLDYDVDVRLKALAEGQGIIEKRLDAVEGRLAEVKALAESTADKVDVIHAVVTQHSTSIAELKAAQ